MQCWWAARGVTGGRRTVREHFGGVCCLLVGGAGGTFRRLRASVRAKTLTVSAIEELDTRYMSLQAHLSSQHITLGSRKQVVLFARARAWSRRFSGRARGGSWSGLGAGFDAVSTAVKRSFNGGSRRKSLSSSKVQLSAASQCTGRRAAANEGPCESRTRTNCQSAVERALGEGA